MAFLKERKLFSKALKQMARLRWAVEGDENSKYFHGVVKAKRARNKIRGLIHNRAWPEDPRTIKEAACQYFTNQFREPNKDKPAFLSERIRKLTAEQATTLEASLTELEIKNTVRMCSRGKVPGPNGLNFNFIKAN